MHVLESRAEKKKSFSFPISSPNKLLYGLEVSFFIRAFPLEKDFSMMLVSGFVLSLFLDFIPLMSGKAGVQPDCPEVVISRGKGMISMGKGRCLAGECWKSENEAFLTTKDSNTTLIPMTFNWTTRELFPCFL